MATAVIPNENADTSDDYLEIFSVVWFDANINIEDIRDTKKKLRIIINHIKKFEDVKECQQYIQHRSKQDRILLIVGGGRLDQELVSSVHQLRQVSSIYIYCMDKKNNEEWVSKFSKIKAIVIEIDDLISKIKLDYVIQKKIEEPLSINMFSTTDGAGKSTKGVNGEFVFFQLLIDCLLRMRSNQMDKNELITLCKKEYENNDSELNNIVEFENNYSYEKALWWYTRDTFFYKILNKALRSQNIHMLFLFRSFIVDIRRQLYHYMHSKSVHVYRSQLMSIEELDDLKKNIGQFISINSFFSTSNEPSIALLFMANTNQETNLERVLFEIEAVYNADTTKPFADISSQSHFAEESEVLFMLGSIFRLNSISYGDNQIWTIRMTLCSDDEHEFKQVFTFMKKQNGTGETNLRIFAKILWKMGKLDLAEKYYIRLINQISTNDPLLLNLYENLGEIAALKHDYNMSIQWHQKSLNIKQSTVSTTTTNHNIDRIRNFLATSLLIDIDPNASWTQNKVTVAGSNNSEDHLDRFYGSFGFCIDEDQTIYIAGLYARRIVEWKSGATSGLVVIGAHDYEDKNDDLGGPTCVIIDKQTDSLIICDWINQRVVQWPRRDGIEGITLISNIHCWGAAIGNDGCLYVSDMRKNEVRRWQIGDTDAEVVAGGNGAGDSLNQLNDPRHLFVDHNNSIYVADSGNHRVMKWIKGAKEGIVVAGGNGPGNALTQLCGPDAVIVDKQENVYVADGSNHRIVRWHKDAIEGNIVVHMNTKDEQEPYSFNPVCLAFDLYYNLYALDYSNDEILRFSLVNHHS